MDTKNGSINGHLLSPIPMWDRPRTSGHETAASWSDAQTLHVAVAYTNPCRWRSRRELFEEFRQHMEASPNVRLYVGEISYGDRPFEVTDSRRPGDFQFRTTDELFHKENLLNRVITGFPSDWKYGAVIDGDFHFTRHDWAIEAIQQLQLYRWVQLFSTYADLSHDHRPMQILPGFAYGLAHGLDSAGKKTSGYGRPGSPGGAWAFQRTAFDSVGGLLDQCILGSGDWHMAVGLAQLPTTHPDTSKCGEVYRRHIRAWQDRAKSENKNIGYLNCHAVHHFHGPKNKRGYGWRSRGTRDHDFNPERDIFRDWQGIYQLTRDKPDLRDDIRRYFRSRNEDDLGLDQASRMIA